MTEDVHDLPAVKSNLTKSTYLRMILIVVALVIMVMKLSNKYLMDSLTLKGRLSVPLSMNFWKSSKRPLTNSNFKILTVNVEG